MTSYNSYAEKRIDDLINQAGNHQEIGMANQILIEAGDILDKEFNHYLNDSSEDMARRLETKQRIYNKILGAYDQIIQNSLDMEDENLGELMDLKRGLENI